MLVTQGTVNNFDFGQLVAPTLAALANEPDVLVIVTGGGRPVDAIPGPIPSNARLASYLPFEWALAKADVFVTNGGYGSVNQALSFGIPLVTAGLTEDKADVNARVAWSGVGINLATNEPTPEALREAVRAVLDKPDYRSRASAWPRSLAGSTRDPKSFAFSMRFRGGQRRSEAVESRVDDFVGRCPRRFLNQKRRRLASAYRLTTQGLKWVMD